MFNVIGKINQLLFLLTAMLLIGLFSSELYSKWNRNDPYERPKVLISNEDSEKVDDVESTQEIELVELLNGIYIFSVENEVIDPTKYRDKASTAEYRMPVFGHHSEKTVNYIFADLEGNKVVLLKKDALVLTFLPANLGDYKDKPKFDKNIYHIVEEDTNGDGFLTREDSEALYLSDFNGQNLKVIVKNVVSSFILDEDTLVIVTKDLDEKSFFHYSVKDANLIKIDVDTKLTRPSI